MLLLAFLSLLPASKGFDRAPENQANPEVYNHTQVRLSHLVPCGWRQVRHKQEVHDISQHDGDEALQQIHSSLF